MELIPDSRKSGVYDDTHPLTIEFKSPSGIAVYNSRLEVGQTGVVGMTPTGLAAFAYSTNVDPRDAADLLRRHLSINKSQLVVGRVIMVQPIPNTNCISFHLALPPVEGGEEWILGYMGIDPYHPREVKAAKQSTGPRSSDSGSPLMVVDDTATTVAA